MFEHDNPDYVFKIKAENFRLKQELDELSWLYNSDKDRLTKENEYLRNKVAQLELIVGRFKTLNLSAGQNNV